MFEIENLDELEKMVSEDVNSKIPEISDCLIRYSVDDLGKISAMNFLFYTSEDQKDNTDKIVEYIAEAERMGIKILPPDVNESYANFTMISKDEVRFGLSAVKNVGEGSIESIIESNSC